MKSRTSLLVVVAVAVTLLSLGGETTGAGQSPPSGQPARLFRLYPDDFWLNLHQFLYVLGRAEAKLPDIKRRAVVGAPAEQDIGLGQLSTNEQRDWRESVRVYAEGPSRQDAVFDDPMIIAGKALADVANSTSLSATNLEPSLKGALERAAPIYRKAWWPAHRAANQKWIAAIEPLIDRHGQSILAFITRAYGLAWPASGYPVHLSGYANWAGAFSTRENLLVISSLDSGNVGTSALETIFHEATHQWDDQVLNRLREIAQTDGTAVPPDLTHALIWVTAGEAVRRAVPGHVPYAEANGLWRGRLGALKPALESAWVPYLNGQGTRDAAFAEILRRLR